MFSPIVKHLSLRILLALVAVKDMHLEQIDVKTAFLHGELDEMIVMAQPEGYVNPEKADYVCHLKKSLYRLKQSPRLWYLRFDMFMSEHGFQEVVLTAVYILNRWRMTPRFICCYTLMIC